MTGSSSLKKLGFIGLLQYYAENQPEKSALVGTNKELSYASLHQALSDIAAHLSQYQASKDNPVALLLDHTEALIQAILGVHFAGLCYSPLDVSFPAARLKKALSNIAPSILITEKKYYALASSSVGPETHVLLIDELLTSPLDLQCNTAVPLTPTDNAYLLSTSGTTGEPKGIAHNLRSLLRSVKHYIDDLGVTNEDKIGLILPCTYTPSVFSIFGAIATGATLYPFDLKNSSFKQIADWIKAQRITLLYSSPTLFRTLMKECHDPSALASLRSIQLAGEPVFRSDIVAYQARFSQYFDLYNGMGSSETSCLTRFFIDKTTVISGERVPIGLPYNDVEFYICDDEGNPVPDEQEGHLIVEGSYFTQGYWQRPDLTEEKFRDTSTPNTRRYLTGDRALRQHDGNFVHLGRSDDQIKLRGQRVELAAIESTLLHSGLASNSAVVLIDAEGKDPFIAAFFAPVNDITAVREYLSSQLPPFMIPTRIVAMAALPLNTSGKVDRRRLKAYDFSALDESTESAPSVPGNVIETRILDCFQHVLKNNDLHVNSDFFAAGGDSINGVELAIEIEEALSIPINVSALIEAPTPRKMGQLAQRSLQVGKSATLVKFEGPDTQAHTLPLFCLPGLPGNALAYRELASEMTQFFTLYSFVYPGQDGSGKYFSTVEDFVQVCMDEINSVYPDGPIALVCYSIGGTIGYELVRKLKSAGRKIALFTMIDCYTPNSIKEQHIRKECRSTIKRLVGQQGSDFQRHREASDAAITNAVFLHRVEPQEIDNTLLITANDQRTVLRLHDNYSQWSTLISPEFKTVKVSGTHTDMLKQEKAAEITGIINAFLSDSHKSVYPESTISMKSLSEIWSFKGANSLSFSEINEVEMESPVIALLAQPKQLTERLQNHLNDEIRTKLITSTQKGRFYNRKVALQTKSTNKTVVVAAIQIAMNLFDSSFAADILQTDKPFGTILKCHSIEYSCEVVSLFNVDPDADLLQAFDKTHFSGRLSGRCSRFTNAQGQTLANVIEILAPWL